MMDKTKKQTTAGWLVTCLLVFFAACTNQSQENATDNNATDSADVTASTEVDTIVSKFTDQETIRVVAGNSIGDFLIDQEIEESNLFNRFGEVDSSDAAMCKSWSMWYLENDREVTEATLEFDVYAACDADIDMKKSIQVMRLSNVPFDMDNGISFDTNWSVLKESYPDGVELVYTDALSDAIIKVYDDVAAGIAFELRNDKVKAVIVHEPDQAIENMYMPFYKQQ